jgi:hypothetical protein
MKSSRSQRHKRDQLLLDIDGARTRHAWAAAEMRKTGSTPALMTFVAEAHQECLFLLNKLAKFRELVSSAKLANIRVDHVTANPDRSK